MRTGLSGAGRLEKRYAVCKPFRFWASRARRVEEERLSANLTRPAAAAFSIVQKTQPGIPKSFRNAWLGCRGDTASSEDAADLLEQHSFYERAKCPALARTYCSSATSFAAKSAEVLEAM